MSTKATNVQATNTEAKSTEVTSSKATKKDAPGTETPIRVLKIAHCPSLSGESELTYEVGCDPEGEIRFRIVGNSAAGAFNQEWIAFPAIRKALSIAPSGALTSFHLREIYRGKSVNSPPFLLAVLKNEGIVAPSTTTRRCHEVADDTKFVAAVRALMDSTDGPRVEKASAKARVKKVMAPKEVRSAGGKEEVTSISTESTPADVAPSVPSKAQAKTASKGLKSAAPKGKKK